VEQAFVLSILNHDRILPQWADEEGTLERLKALRRELVDPKIAEYRGRIVKTTGDGMLAEFPSGVDAVRCAVEVQQAMPERNIGVAADKCIELRIGINLGDVIVEGDDIYGDGVNIAARIEALADAGGVFVFNTVHDHVRDRLPFAFEDLGEQRRGCLIGLNFIEAPANFSQFLSGRAAMFVKFHRVVRHDRLPFLSLEGHACATASSMCNEPAAGRKPGAISQWINLRRLAILHSDSFEAFA
jgi:hypothetical protein